MLLKIQFRLKRTHIKQLNKSQTHKNKDKEKLETIYIVVFPLVFCSLPVTFEKKSF